MCVCGRSLVYILLEVRLYIEIMLLLVYDLLDGFYLLLFRCSIIVVVYFFLMAEDCYVISSFYCSL